MFELGLRLGFDKPTIIVKDDKTSYSFDTSPIEHIEYPRDLRFAQIVDFKNKLSKKIKATHTKASTDATYTTFLKHFGEFTVAKIEQKEVPAQEAMLEELQEIRVALRQLGSRSIGRLSERRDIDLCLRSLKHEAREKLFREVGKLPDVASVVLEDRGNEHFHLVVMPKPGSARDELRNQIREMISAERSKKTRELKKSQVK